MMKQAFLPASKCPGTVSIAVVTGFGVGGSSWAPASSSSWPAGCRVAARAQLARLKANKGGAAPPNWGRFHA